MKVAVYFSTLCIVRVDLSEPANGLVPKRKPWGHVYYQLDYDVIMRFGLTELTAELSWKTKVTGQCLLPSHY